MSERQILIDLIAGLSLADHMGDALGDCGQALKRIGIKIPSIFESPLEDPDEWEHLAHFLASNHSAQTIWGTPLLEDGEDQ